MRISKKIVLEALKLDSGVSVGCVFGGQLMRSLYFFKGLLVGGDARAILPRVRLYLLSLACLALAAASLRPRLAGSFGRL